MGRSIEIRLANYLSERLRADKHSVKSFSQLTGISTGTIDRAKRGEVSIGIDTLMGIAKGLRLKPWELLQKIDPSNPDTYKEENAEERRILDVFSRTDDLGRQTILNAVVVAAERMKGPK